MLFESFLAIEKLLAIFDVALEKHLVGYVGNVVCISWKVAD